jgi:hypothetical protein
MFASLGGDKMDDKTLKATKECERSLSIYKEDLKHIKKISNDDIRSAIGSFMDVKTTDTLSKTGLKDIWKDGGSNLETTKFDNKHQSDDEEEKSELENKIKDPDDVKFFSKLDTTKVFVKHLKTSSLSEESQK